MAEVPGLQEALKLLAQGVGVGAILAFLFETAPFISVWFKGLASTAKWWIVFLLSVLLPLGAQLVLDFVPAETVVALEPYFRTLALGFLAWAGTQGFHIVFNKTLNGK